MKRFVVSLPDELFLALQKAANKRRTSIASVLREAAEKEVCPPRPRPRTIGIASSGDGNLARRATEEQFVPDPFR